MNLSNITKSTVTKNRMALTFVLAFLSVLVLNFSLATAQCPSGSSASPCAGCPSAKECGKDKPKSAAAKSAQVNTAKSSSEDEFFDYSPEENNATSDGGDDEFGNDDEFEDYDESTDTLTTASASDTKDTTEAEEVPIYKHHLFFPMASLVMTALAGIFVRFRQTRKLRPLFLALSMIVLGFYIGACPCPVSSFVWTVIAIFGGKVYWEGMIWFLALIPLTYVFHKTWCGWVCHLGALQEFLYVKKYSWDFMRTKRTQTILKVLRYAIVLAVVTEAVIANTYTFHKYDPIRTAYNLGYGAGYFEWIMLGLFLVLSMFSYRPFCKVACPIGLVLGWVANIPGAAVIDSSDSCVNCKSCSKSCDYQAIMRENNISTVNNHDCIACGDCMGSCKLSSAQMYRKGKKHKVVNSFNKQ